MSERTTSIKEEYEYELSEINYVLTQLENERVYGINGAQSDGSLPHNAQKLKKMIANLINKIDKQKPSDGDLDNSLFEKKQE